MSGLERCPEKTVVRVRGVRIGEVFGLERCPEKTGDRKRQLSGL